VVDGPKVQEVDSFVGTCTCPVLNTSSAPCQHQLAVLVRFGKHTFLNPAAEKLPSTSSKICLYEIATGNKIVLPENWTDSECAFISNTNKSDDFSATLNKIKMKVGKNSAFFQEAVTQFCKTCENMNEAQIASALANFGSNDSTEK